VAKYLELHDGSCPLFKHAPELVYKKALSDLDALASQQMTISSQEEVNYWLDVLFKLPMIKAIKATSYGEFKEWMALDSWWLQDYFRLHRVAHKRGATIERTFIVRNEHQAKTVETVFKNNRKYNVLVKVAIEGRIRAADMDAKNCLVFCDKRNEPVYALVAHHTHKEEFQSAVIFGAPSEVAKVATMYAHIDNIAEPYEADELVPLKTA